MPTKTLHTNRRLALGFALSGGLFDADRPRRIALQAAVAKLGRWVQKVDTSRHGSPATVHCK